MSRKHLGPGSTDVPLSEGKLRLYSMRFCPFAQRVHFVLTAKKIPHDVVNINLKNKPDWYLEKFPLGKVPAVIDEGKGLFESLIVSEYLDEKYPGKKLYPQDPLKKALDKMLIEVFNKVIPLYYRCVMSPTLDITMLNAVFDEMDYFEKELNQRGSLYFSGEKPGMVDYMIWPWCERMEMLKVIGGNSFKIPKERFPKLLGWCGAMLEDDVVKEHYLTPEIHAQHFQSVKAGTPDYDNIVGA